MPRLGAGSALKRLRLVTHACFGVKFHLPAKSGHLAQCARERRGRGPRPLRSSVTSVVRLEAPVGGRDVESWCYRPGNTFRDKTPSKRCPRPDPGRRYRGHSHEPFRTPLRFSFRTRTPRSDTKAAPQNKYRENCKATTCITRGFSFSRSGHCWALFERGLSFSRAPKHERMHLNCIYHIRHQSEPCPPIHACSAPSAKRVATKCASTQSELRATVNCRMGSYRSTGNWLRFFIQRSPRCQPCIRL